MSTVFLDLSERSYSVDCASESRFVFNFPAGEAEVSRSGEDLVFLLENGISVTLEGFYSSYSAQNMPVFEVEGLEVAGEDFLAASTASAAWTPAGRTAEAGTSAQAVAAQAAMPNRPPKSWPSPFP